MDSAYVKNLIMTVINHSESSCWEDAVTEWEIYDCEEDDSCSSECICGKENIKYLYTIRNKLNDEKLYPIGSSCIRKFNRRLDICMVIHMGRTRRQQVLIVDLL